MRLVLQPDSSATTHPRAPVDAGNERNAYHLGFLEAIPDALPATVTARADGASIRDRAGQPCRPAAASLLVKALDSPGQRFLAVTEQQLRHPLDKYTTAPVRRHRQLFRAGAIRRGAEDIACAGAGGALAASGEKYRRRANGDADTSAGGYCGGTLSHCGGAPGQRQSSLNQRSGTLLFQTQARTDCRAAAVADCGLARQK